MEGAKNIYLEKNFPGKKPNEGIYVHAF